jgi:hypothetical protein
MVRRHEGRAWLVHEDDLGLHGNQSRDAQLDLFGKNLSSGASPSALR